MRTRAITNATIAVSTALTHNFTDIGSADPVSFFVTQHIMVAEASKFFTLFVLKKAKCGKNISSRS